MKSRREILKSMIAMPFIASDTATFAKINSPLVIPPKGRQLKTSLNAFSFNDVLLAGKMNLNELIDFCIEQQFDAVDITGYYFPGYPAVPADEYIFHLKKKAFLSGLEISGTGIRNDFTDPDPLRRKEGIQIIKNWIEVAQKLGAPVIRIFAGNQDRPEYTWDQVAEWMVKDFKECIEYGKQRGIIVGIQNHNDFIRSAAHVARIMEMVGSEWSGLIMDTGGYRTGDPYQQIEQTIKYAVNWQIKEKIFVNGIEQDTDINKLIAIIKASSYKGYLPIETLGAGDSKLKVITLLQKLRNAL
ncbi:MAG: sugar phosphate isomerase/epimerase family protein [Ginsengibacter sp.]